MSCDVSKSSGSAINPVLKLWTSFTDAEASSVTASSCATASLISRQSLTHGFRQRIDRAAQQHRQRNQTPDQGLATRTLSLRSSTAPLACAVAIDQYFILKRFTIRRHLASHSKFVPSTSSARAAEKALIGIELQLSHQAQPVAGSEFNRGPRGELLCAARACSLKVVF